MHIGALLIALGSFFEIVGAIGINRMPDFFTRVHAVTVSVIGGTVLPLIGVAVVAMHHPSLIWGGAHLALICLASSSFILIVSPSGTHALVRAAYIAGRGPSGDEDELAKRIKAEMGFG